MDSTLLLNASFQPLKVISWQRAVTLLFLGKAEVVDVYDNEIRSVSIVIKMPAVVRLLRYVRLTKQRPPLTRLNLLARDGFHCQYCGRELSYSEATIDHVKPRSQGGLTTWENVVTACPPCNRHKGGKTPQQARMALLRDPFEPEWLPVITLKFRRHVPKSWRLFLGEEDT